MVYSDSPSLSENANIANILLHRSQHKYSTAKFKISPRKLNKLAHQISGLPVGEAILQMKFSEKRASQRIKSTLALARNHAADKGLDQGRLIVGEFSFTGPTRVKIAVA
jgi:large subunit ribosomal protein L22